MHETTRIKKMYNMMAANQTEGRVGPHMNNFHKVLTPYYSEGHNYFTLL